MTVEATNLEILKYKNEMKLLKLMPVELWRIVDEFSDAKTHTRLRASCSSMRDWIPREKMWNLMNTRYCGKKYVREALKMNV